MSETDTRTDTPPQPEDTVETLRTRTADLERQLDEIRRTHDERIMRAELKAEAVRHGMVDLDGLKLMDTEGLALTDKGEVAGAGGAMARLKRAKPWLFGSPNSSSSAAPPPSAPPRQKTALEMNEDEYRRARGDLLKRRK
jgi:hypothetical protein